MMKPKKYSTNFAKLSNLILSMSDEQQAKLVELIPRVQNEENLPTKTEQKSPSLYFTSGVIVGWGLVTILFLFLSAT